MIKNLDNNREIFVQFNPREYTLEKSVQWESQKAVGLNAPGLQFTSGNCLSLSLELFFDTYEAGTDVRDKTKYVEDLALVYVEEHRPPICQFCWGQFLFKGILETVSSRYTMFKSDGTPVRATLNVKFKEYTTPEEQKQMKPNHSADHTKSRMVKQGDTLALIAAQEYDDPAEWRKIADANELDDPLALEPGMKITVPRIL